MNARPFLFDTDFRKPRPDLAAEAAAREAVSVAAAADRAAAEALARGLEAGRAEGRAEAHAQLQARLADAMNRLALSVAGLMAQADAREAEREAQAVEVAVLLARRIAGEALDAQPLAVIGEAARGALQHLRGVPHLAVRVHDSLVEETEALLRRLARERGFEGRLVVLGEPDLERGDARIEWADGGIVRERARIESAITRALGLAHPDPSSDPSPEPPRPVMSDDFSLPQLGEHDAGLDADSIREAPTSPKSAADLEQLFDVPVMVSAVLGNSRMPIGDLLRLGPGTVLELDRKVGEAIDIFVNNRLVARGEVVLVEDRLGVTMTEIVKSEH